MENRQPGPEGTENTTTSRAAKAENVAAWLQRRRDTERNVILKDILDKDKTDEGNKKSKRKLRFGSAFLQTEEPKEAADAPTQSADGSSAETDKTADSATEVSTELLSGDNETQHAEATTDENSEVSRGVDNESDALAGTLGSEADWPGQRVVEPTEQTGFSAFEAATVNDAWAQLYEPAVVNSEQSPAVNSESTESDYGSPFNAAWAEQPQEQQTAWQEQSEPTPVPPRSHGGGGAEPPVNRPGDSASAPFNPNQPSSYDTLQPAYVPPAEAAINVPYVNTPNRLRDHDHEHGHPRLALAMAAGLIVEHILGKRADKRIDAEMRRRTDRLREQIEESQVNQAEAQTKLRAEQTRLAEAQQTQAERQETAERHVDIRPARSSVERTEPMQVFNRAEVYAPVIARQAEMPYARASEVMPARSTENMSRPPIEAPPIEMEHMPFAPDTDAFAEANVRPNVVAEQVAVAAEKDVAVERVYERRQEVRDDPGAGGAQGGGQSSGNTDSGGGSMYQSTDGLYTQASAYNTSRTNSGTDNNAASQYKAAVIRGVGGALALIVLGLMAFALL